MPDTAPPAPPMLTRRVEGIQAWTRDQLIVADWRLAVPPEAIAELHGLVASLRADPLPTPLLEPGMFALPACRALMARAREITDQGVGVVILDRLPLDAWSEQEGIAVYWLLASMVARPVAQKWAAQPGWGQMIYSVTDLGRPPGQGVKVDVTNHELTFHTDNSSNHTAPEYVSLLCLRPALAGGISKVASCYTLHNMMLERHPQLLPRLYRPVLFDRQREHAEGDPETLANPIFEWDGGKLSIRLSVGRILKGYEVAGVPIDPEGKAAIEALMAVQEDASVWLDFLFERGQVQILNNHFLGHLRTSFTDGPTPETKRHLIRLWLRNAGRRSFRG